MALLLAGAGPASAMEPGEALYALGARPGAVAPRAVAAGGAVLPASALPCAGCHGADGAGGRAEAGVRPPPVAWSALSRPTPERPAYDEAALLRTVAQGVAAGGRALDPAMPRYALTLDDGQALVAWLRALDAPRATPGVTEDRVRLGLLLPPGPRGEAFAAAFAGALKAAAPVGVFGRRIERVVAPAAGEPSDAVRLLLGEGVLALVSALPEEANAAALAAAGVARVPLLSVRAGEDMAPLGYALLPGAVDEGVALLRALPEPGRAAILAGNAAEARLGGRIADRVAALTGAEPPVVGAAELRAARAEGVAAVLALAPASGLAEAVAPLREIALPVLVVGSRGGLAAPAGAAVLGRPVLVGLGVPAEMGDGVALARFRAGEAARAGLTGRLGHAMGEVVVEALRRGGRGVTREKLAAAFAGPPFDTGALPPLRLFGGARGGGGGGIRLFQVDGTGRVLRGPATAGAD
ncbi:hypothetical protein GCM10009416_43680 [Craurococcus roseus]|uniref:Cytochrome c domain-containing protein n=1 Tax=Craurococcus roseus TaxID=77585 RepID=A0ABP3R779_9PROT